MDQAVSPTLSAIFASLVEEYAGIHYGVNDRSIFESKLVAHAADCGYDTLLDFYYRLRYDDADKRDLRALVEALCVHETYFFRELPPLVQLVDGHLREVIAKRGRARVWSAACATGEEPLTLAMLLADRGMLDKVQIIASDVSETVVERAREGRYGRRALRDGHPIDIAARYLERTGTGVQVAPDIRDAVTFANVNLIDPDAVTRLGPFDAILCRNVLIYFRDEVAVRVVDQLGRALAPGGLLVVGVSESLLRFGTALVCEEHGGWFFYRRPA